MNRLDDDDVKTVVKARSLGIKDLDTNSLLETIGELKKENGRLREPPIEMTQRKFITRLVKEWSPLPNARKQKSLLRSLASGKPVSIDDLTKLIKQQRRSGKSKENTVMGLIRDTKATLRNLSGLDKQILFRPLRGKPFVGYKLVFSNEFVDTLRKIGVRIIQPR